MTSAPATTATTFNNFCPLPSRDCIVGRRIARQTPVAVTISNTTGAECLVMRARPRNNEQSARSCQAQSWKALVAQTIADADNSATGRSVMTTGQWAATVGSMTRNSKVARATLELNARLSAKATHPNRRPFSMYIAVRARLWTESASLVWKTRVSVNMRSSGLSLN
jgi:hypothetical protein